MLNNTILWVQSPNHLEDDLLYVNGCAINKDHPNHSNYINEVLSIDNNKRILDNGSLSIYQCADNCYHISSNFVDSDDSGRKLAFVAKIWAESVNDVALILSELIKGCGYRINPDSLSIIDVALKKNKRFKNLLKISLWITIMLTIVTVVLILMFQKCSVK